MAALLRTGAAERAARSQLEALIKQKKLIRLTGDLVFHAEAIEKVKSALQRRKGQRFSVPEFKQWTNVSRKFAIPLLEYFDREHITRRAGDSRLVI